MTDKINVAGLVRCSLYTQDAARGPAVTPVKPDKQVAVAQEGRTRAEPLQLPRQPAKHRGMPANQSSEGRLAKYRP